MVVSVIYPSNGWILNRLGDELVSRIPCFVKPGKGVSADLNYYINYGLMKSKSTKIDVGFFTHPESNGEFFKMAPKYDFFVSMCPQYHRLLVSLGYTGRMIVPGVDHSKFFPKIRVGVFGRMNTDIKREIKGFDLIEKLKKVNFVELVFTNGLKPASDIPNLYRTVDYVLVTSTVEGGPMSLIEGLAMGKPVICPKDVGFAEMFSNQIIDYKKGDFHSLFQVLEHLYQNIKNTSNVVEEYTWDRWAHEHAAYFKYLIENHGKNKRVC